MIKKFFFAATALLGVSAVYAETLTPEQALQRVNAQPSAKRALAGNANPQLVFTAKTLKGEASLYVFNKAKNNGYMILSADDIALPMLGYTDSGDFDPNNIPPMVKYWFDEYSRQIEYAKAHEEELLKSSEVTMDFPSSWTLIDPMLSTNWNQGDPYNLMTPTYGNSHYSTGCVATAMAQVMKYWSYPEIGSGSISFYSGIPGNPNTGYVNQTLSMSFDEQPFQWDDMLDNYVSGQYTQAQANAVAYLMKACGYSSEMQYGIGGSGTQSELCGVALSKYFGYDRNIQSEQRLQYSATEWNALVYDQLKNVGPVIYSGMSTEGAHCFVLDGYEGDGYFHFNWGWGGVCNGFYQLNALNPTQQGTGGFFGGYNFVQSILTGVQKPTGQPAETKDVTMTLNGTVEGLVQVSGANTLLKFTLTGANPSSIGNDSMEDIRPTFGYEFVSDKGGLPTYVTCGAPSISNTFPPGSYWEASNASGYPVVFQGVIPANLADGRYKVTVIVRNNLGFDKGWKHFMIADGNYDYIYLTKTGDKFEVENFQPQRYKMENANITTPLYFNNPCEIEIKVTNPTDVEITQSVLPWLYIGSRAQYKGESRLITLMPGETKTVTMTTTFQRLNNGETPTVNNPKDFDLLIQNYNTGDFYGNFGSYAMKRSSTNARASLLNMQILNAVEMTEIMGNKVYSTNNMVNPEVEVDLEVKGGFIASPITISVFEYDLATNTVGSQVYEKDIAQMIYAEANETANVKSTLNFYDVNTGKEYLLSAYYLYNNNRRALGSVVMKASSGIEDILAGAKGFELENIGGIIRGASDSGKVILSVYDAKGALVGTAEGNVAEYNLNNLSAGLYIVYARNAEGEVKTVKVIR